MEYSYPLWEIKDKIGCVDCGQTCLGYRLVKTSNYDRLNDAQPEFRCSTCSKEKVKKLISRGVSL